jgi:hypothetical protein
MTNPIDDLASELDLEDALEDDAEYGEGLNDAGHPALTELRGQLDDQIATAQKNTAAALRQFINPPPLPRWMSEGGL